MKERLDRLRNASLSAQLATLALVVVVIFGLVAPWAGSVKGVVGVAAAAVAAALCLTGAGVALVAGRLSRGPNGALVGVLLGMGARMAIPLGGGFALQIRGGPLAEAGLLYYLLAFYPMTLALETWLSLPETQPAGHGSENQCPRDSLSESGVSLGPRDSLSESGVSLGPRDSLSESGASLKKKGSRGSISDR